jgi:CP family cyanate transporter-like MFS transporter
LAIPPVVPLLHTDLHLSETSIGWLSSLPPMLFAIAAVPSALIIARLGMVPALLVGLFLTAAGSAARGALADAAFLYVSTIAMSAGVATVQTVMPPLVRSWFPERIGLATTVYTNGLLIGEILPVALTIPLMLPLLQNSWRLDLVFWSLPVLATALFVATRAPGTGVTKGAATPASRRWWPDWRNAIIWRLGLILGSVKFDLLRQQRLSSRLRHRPRPS